MLKDITEEWEKVTWEVLSNVQTGRISLADAQEKLDTLKAETVQIVAREVLKKVREGVPKEKDMKTALDTHSDAGAGDVIGHNYCRKDFLTHLQSLEDELSAEVLSK